MKRTINEAQLKAIVAESVKRVLGEMDWKTYQWAADERKRRNDDVFANRENSPYYEKYKKTLPFLRHKDSQRAAADAFNKEYGMDDYTYDGKGGVDYRTVRMDDSDGIVDGEYRYFTPDGRCGTHDIAWGRYNLDTKDDITRNAYQRANDEVNNYRNGNYTYVKGKGWELKK